MLTDLHAYNLIPAKCITREHSNEAINLYLGAIGNEIVFPLWAGIEKETSALVGKRFELGSF